MRFLSVFFVFLCLALSFIPLPINAAPSITGKYLIQGGCSDAKQCCCILGSINLSGTEGGSMISISSQLRAACAANNNPPTLTGSLIKQANGVYNTTATIRGEPYTIQLAASGALYFRNNAIRPTTCNFAALRNPSEADKDKNNEKKPCTNPTKEQVEACVANWNNLKPCEKEQEKEINKETCCPICRPSILPPRPKCSMEDIDRCGDNEKPFFNNITGCPSCIAPEPGKNCPAAELIPSVACPPGVPPARTPNSCVSCKVTKDSEKCSKEKQKDCNKAIESGLIPVCAANAEPTFNITTCCRTCIKRDDNDEGPADKKKCTKEEMNACMATIPVCEDGEKPFANKTKCCPSCRRPERGCKIADVTVCRASQRVCASGELPSHIDGECCATCKLPPPTCTPACNVSSICVPNVVPGATADQIQNAAGKCLSKGKIKARINVALAGGAVDSPSVAAIIIEIIHRYCDRAENAEKCSQLTAILNSITVTANSAGLTSGDVDATIEYSNQLPANESPSSASFALLSLHPSFRLFAESVDSSAFVTAALNDPSSTDTVTVSSVTVDNGNNPQSGAGAVYPSILVGVIAFLFAFLKY